MKVILQQDVKGQGKKGQMIDVSDGYARNFLLPRKLALPATTDTINAMRVAENAKIAARAREKENAKVLAGKLAEMPVKVVAKAGANGRLFGAVTSKEISDALKAQYGVEIEKNKIVQNDPIKSYGKYEVKCRLGYEISGTIYVIVTEAK
ncbi:MAG: 50S ribosomal protein L9 [Ruminococcaceae bacterium]|nr:50S ribosomal protein L9 [Oscillospiraceae bacterium]